MTAPAAPALLAACPLCLSMHTFATEHDCSQWMQHHAHERSDYSDE